MALFGSKPGSMGAAMPVTPVKGSMGPAGMPPSNTAGGPLGSGTAGGGNMQLVQPHQHSKPTGPAGKYLGHFRNAKFLKAGHNTTPEPKTFQGKSMAPGGGGRFAKMVSGLEKSGKSAGAAAAIAASAGRKKYGASKFAAMGAAGRRRAS